MPLRIYLKAHQKGELRNLYKDSQEGTFEVEIKGAFDVTIELHLKMHMVVHLLVNMSAQNDSR